MQKKKVKCKKGKILLSFNMYSLQLRFSGHIANMWMQHVALVRMFSLTIKAHSACLHASPSPVVTHSTPSTHFFTPLSYHTVKLGHPICPSTFLISETRPLPSSVIPLVTLLLPHPIPCRHHHYRHIPVGHFLHFLLIVAAPTLTQTSTILCPPISSTHWQISSTLETKSKIYGKASMALQRYLFK